MDNGVFHQCNILDMSCILSTNSCSYPQRTQEARFSLFFNLKSFGIHLNWELVINTWLKWKVTFLNWSWFASNQVYYHKPLTTLLTRKHTTYLYLALCFFLMIHWRETKRASPVSICISSVDSIGYASVGVHTGECFHMANLECHDVYDCVWAPVSKTFLENIPLLFTLTQTLRKGEIWF